MMQALFSAGTGLIAQGLSLDNAANNIANVNTNGFKRTSSEFQNLLSTGQDGSQIGLGVRNSAFKRDFSQGTAIVTDLELDVFIQGDGFFEVLLPSGDSAFVRDGSFSLDANGQFVTSNGFRIEPEIIIPQETTSINIANDGTVSVLTATSPIFPVFVGNIELTRFQNSNGLRAAGNNLFFETVDSGEPMTGTPGTEARGTLEQGVVELSNVDIASELIELITAQRAFEFNSRAFRTADEVIQTANNLVRVFG